MQRSLSRYARCFNAVGTVLQAVRMQRACCLNACCANACCLNAGCCWVAVSWLFRRDHNAVTLTRGGCLTTA
eukprot:885546-Lingulodinium_polyedra.AAC.1